MEGFRKTEALEDARRQRPMEATTDDGAVGMSQKDMDSLETARRNRAEWETGKRQTSLKVGNRSLATTVGVVLPAPGPNIGW